MTVNPRKLHAARCVTAILRAGGRSTTMAIARDAGLHPQRVRRVLELALGERLVFSRDRNAWTATATARRLYAEGQQAAA